MPDAPASGWGLIASPVSVVFGVLEALAEPAHMGFALLCCLWRA